LQGTPTPTAINHPRLLTPPHVSHSAAANKHSRRSSTQHQQAPRWFHYYLHNGRDYAFAFVCLYVSRTENKEEKLCRVRTRYENRTTRTNSKAGEQLCVMSREQERKTTKTEWMHAIVKDDFRSQCLDTEQASEFERDRSLPKLASSYYTARASCGAVYCNRSCLFMCVCLWVCYHDNSITNCVHRSSPNWACR